MEQIDREFVLSHGQDHTASPQNCASEAPSGLPLSATDFDSAVLRSLHLSPHTIRKLEADAREAGVGVVQTAIASGMLKAGDVFGHISRQFSFSLREAPFRLQMPKSSQHAWMLLDKPVPLAAEGEDIVAINGQTSSMRTLATLAVKLGEKRKQLKILTRQELIDLVTRGHGGWLVGNAVDGLVKARPDWSAKTGLAPWQIYCGAILAGLSLGAIAFAPRETMTLLAITLSFFFLLAIGLRLLALVNLLAPPRRKPEHPLLSDAELPRYTILVPLFREVEILPHLASALRNIDYPPAKLDIKIVLESVDEDTIEAVGKLNLPGNVDVIVVPDRAPRTKPKALNYALQFATGELAVIYDAEDRPDPDQLRKAATTFHFASERLACVQGRLDYFNAQENWLSRQFTIEYATLFAGLLPLFDRFGLPVPLGGTSNHFRISVLRQLGAWDPFNVTEDADLGMRLHRAGYRVEMLDSTTYEEACCRTPPWVKQRTRWLKGWMQTFGVHMRAPAATVRETGLCGFLAFHAYFAGILVSALAHPVFYLVLAHEAISGTLFVYDGSLGGDLLLTVALFNFIGGYVVNLTLGAASLRETRHKGLWPHVVFIPIYWLYVSVAAYRAVWQLVRAPFYWEKTEHGVSRHLKPTSLAEQARSVPEA